MLLPPNDPKKFRGWVTDFSERYEMENAFVNMTIWLIAFYIIDADKWYRLFPWAAMMLSATVIWRDFAYRISRRLTGKWYPRVFRLMLVVVAALPTGAAFVFITQKHVFEYYGNFYAALVVFTWLMTALFALEKLPDRQKKFEKRDAEQPPF